MHTPYVRKAKEKRRSRWVMEDGFRLLPGLSTGDNLRRLRRHLDHVMKLDRRTAGGRRFAMKLRRLHRQAA